MRHRMVTLRQCKRYCLALAWRLVLKIRYVHSLLYVFTAPYYFVNSCFVFVLVLVLVLVLFLFCFCLPRMIQRLTVQLLLITEQADGAHNYEGPRDCAAA